MADRFSRVKKIQMRPGQLAKLYFTVQLRPVQYVCMGGGPGNNVIIITILTMQIIIIMVFQSKIIIMVFQSKKIIIIMAAKRPALGRKKRRRREILPAAKRPAGPFCAAGAKFWRN